MVAGAVCVTGVPVSVLVGAWEMVVRVGTVLVSVTSVRGRWLPVGPALSEDVWASCVVGMITW